MRDSRRSWRKRKKERERKREEKREKERGKEREREKASVVNRSKMDCGRDGLYPSRLGWDAY